MRYAGWSDLDVPPPDRRIKNEPGTWVWRQHLPGGERAVVKLYRRRDALAWMRSRWTGFRVQREFLALQRLQGNALPCTEPLFWSCGRSADHGRHEILVTREIPQARSLRQRIADAPAETSRIDLRALYRDTARMHRCGMFHGTLWASNVLIAPAGGPVDGHYFSDAPRSVLFDCDIRGTSMARGDLLDLSHSVGQALGLPAARLPLEAYGLDAAQRFALAETLERYRPAKLNRSLRRGAALLHRRRQRAPRA